MKAYRVEKKITANSELYAHKNTVEHEGDVHYVKSRRNTIDNRLASS